MRFRSDVWAALLTLLAGAHAPGCAAPPPPSSIAAAAPRRAPTPKEARPEPDPAPAPAAPPAPRCAALQTELPAIAEGPEEPPVPPLVDFGERTLEPFFERLAAVLRGTARDHVRIAVYGDSNMTMDYITGRMRRVLQGRYGDAGHGFVAGGRPWSHYLHMDVRHGAWNGWESYACSTTPTHDDAYGLSGIVGESGSPFSYAYYQTADAGAPVGTNVGRFDVFYLKRRGNGVVRVTLDERPVADLPTDAETDELGYYRLDVPDAPHRLEISPAVPGRIRLLGVTLERSPAPASVVVDSFGVGAMNTMAMARRGPRLNRAMLEKRRYDLIVYMTGAADVFTMDKTPGLLADMIAVERATLPKAPIVLVTPPDRGLNMSFENTISAVKQRREIAQANATVFWDLWEAMGGRDSFGKLYRRGLTVGDGAHFNKAGGAWVGDRFLHALWRAFMDYLAAHPEAGCDDPAGP